MTLAIVLPDLDNTVVARWQRRVSSNLAGKRCHWRTKGVYYQAVCDLLADRPGRVPTWKDVVRAAQPHGSRSTFYEVAGAHARHGLITDLVREDTLDAMQLAWCYRRTDPVATLIDEAKVWSFWPFRERIAAEPAALATMEDSVPAALTAWAVRMPALAHSLDCAPPICAVEDLTVVLDGQMAAMRVTDVLSGVLRRTD